MAVVCVTDCRHHRLYHTDDHTRSGLFSSSQLYFEDIFNKCSQFIVDQATLFYKKHSFIQFKLTISGNDPLSLTCEVCRKPVHWSTNTVRYLYSFWALFVLYWMKLNDKVFYQPSLGSLCSYHIFSCPTRHILLYFKLNNVTLSVENKTPMEFGHTTVTTTTRLRNNSLLFFRINGITKPVTECCIKIVVISSHIGNLLHVAKLSQCIIIINLRYST